MFNNLGSCINETLKSRCVPENFVLQLCDNNFSKARNKNETELWDYKMDINLSDPVDIAKLAKRVLGFHNKSGGALIFGITDDYIIKGFPTSKIVDSVRLNNLLFKYLGKKVKIFQDEIHIPKKNISLWVIFIPKREGSPVAVQKNGPEVQGNPIILKNQYYVRENDEIKLCIDAYDFDRLFSGVSFKNHRAYIYEVDEPFFRLLAPDHRNLYGRDELKHTIIEHLRKGRSYIIELDGVGGVGKSALAIEIVRQLYKTGDYQFIVSLSAKNKVWFGKTETRQAGFSGLTELIEELSEVFQITKEGKNINELKKELIAFMEGYPGIILIDNLEEIEDSNVFNFINDDIPEPIKIIVTSRIGKNLIAKTISIPELKMMEAKKLFYEELEKYEYFNYLDEQKYVDEIIIATGKLPLAIKWAASFIKTYRSLKEIAHLMKKNDTSKKEFLNFCFSSMFDNLSQLAKEVALLNPFLKDDWNTMTLSFALGKSPQDISIAIKELEEKGIVMAAGSSDKSLSILPITMDFLSMKWKQTQQLKKDVVERLSDVFTSHQNDQLLSLDLKTRIDVLMSKINLLETEEKYHEALNVIRLLNQYKLELDVKSELKAQLDFKYAKLLYLSGEIFAGLNSLENFIKNDKDKLLNPLDYIFCGTALLEHGQMNKQNLALDLITENIGKSNKTLPIESIKVYAKTIVSLKPSDKTLMMLSNLLPTIKSVEQSYIVAREMLGYEDQMTILKNSGHLIRIFNNAKNYEDLELDDLQKLNSQIESFHSYLF